VISDRDFLTVDFQQGIKVTNQVLSHNVIHRFSPHPLKSCWLLMQYRGKGPTCKW